MVIQLNSRKLLMMDILMSETCWTHKKWNKIASDIKLAFYSSTITMMHGPINIRFTHQFYQLFINFCTQTGSTHCKQALEVWWRRCKTVHIIGIEEVQTGSDPFRRVKHSRSAMATERNWDVTETFLSVWTFPFNYTWENFTERWRSATERKRDV